MIGVTVRDDQMLHVVDREAELAELHRKLGAQVDEDRRVPFDDDHVALVLVHRERGATAPESDPEDARLALERELLVPFPGAQPGRAEKGPILSELFDHLAHDSP